MKQFKDMNGRTWEVSMNVAALKRVRDLLDIDLMQLPIVDENDPEASLLHRLGTDPVVLVDVLFVMVKPQADATGVTDDQFAEALGGDALADGSEALIAECISFYRPAVRETLMKLREKTQAMDAALIQQLKTAMEDPALDEAIREAAGLPSGDAPESSASTPAR